MNIGRIFGRGSNDSDDGRLDAGWASLVDTSTGHSAGAGHLRIARTAFRGQRAAYMDGFVPGDIEPRRSDHLALVPDGEDQQYDVVVTDYSTLPGGGDAAVALDWRAPELPRSLREEQAA